eukprot:3763864-Amphidinium_carterae.1
MEEPLLKDVGSAKCSSSEFQLTGCPVLAVGWHTAFRRLFWTWWSTTTDKRFLESEINFRHRWPWLLPVMLLLSTSIDLSNAVAHGDLTSWEWVPIDVMMFLIM